MVICFTRTLIFTSDEIILKIYIERILLLPIIDDKLTVNYFKVAITNCPFYK